MRHRIAVSVQSWYVFPINLNNFHYSITMLADLLRIVLFKDIDECQLSTDNCFEGSTCVNTYGAYDCVCPRGLQGDFCDKGTFLLNF